jgi:hypothetical protein
MTTAQTKLLHIAARQVGLNDRQYRTILRTIALVDSSTRLTQDDFERVMAVMEERGWRQSGQAETYWRDRADGQGRFASSRQVAALRRLAPAAGVRIEGMCIRHTAGRTDRPEKLTPREAWQIHEALKAMVGRQDPAVAPRVPQVAGTPETCASARSHTVPADLGVAPVDVDDLPF